MQAWTWTPCVGQRQPFAATETGVRVWDREGGVLEKLRLQGTRSGVEAIEADATLVVLPLFGGSVNVRNCGRQSASRELPSLQVAMCVLQHDILPARHRTQFVARIYALPAAQYHDASGDAGQGTHCGGA